MSINLIESEHRSQKSLGGTFVSVAVHACAISLAVYASASAGEVIVKSPIDSVIVFSPQRPKDPPRSPSHPIARTSPRDPERAPELPRSPITPLSEVPTKLPPLEPWTTTIDDRGLFARSTTDGGLPTGGTSECVVDCDRLPYAYSVNEVEKPATPRSGNPSPKYPSLLESSHVEGSVLVQFVVDTLGVADMSTFTVLESTNDLFAESTRASLTKWRFYPAEARGRRVKQIVRLPLRFVAPHH
jgi:hypothetical protein